MMLELTSEAPQRSLEEFLPAPWRHMHQKWLKVGAACVHVVVCQEGTRVSKGRDCARACVCACA